MNDNCCCSAYPDCCTWPCICGKNKIKKELEVLFSEAKKSWWKNDHERCLAKILALFEKLIENY